jgi:hypothetical protein
VRLGMGGSSAWGWAAARPERKREEAREAGPDQAHGNGRLAVPSSSGARTHRGASRAEARANAGSAGAGEVAEY